MILKICYLAEGQSVHVKKWIGYFADRGHDVHLVTFEKTGQIEGVKVRNLQYFSKFAYPFRILEVKSAVKEIEPDILHAHYVSHYGVYAALTGFRPFVLTAWGSDVLIDPNKSTAKRYAVKYALRSADLITVDSLSSISAVVGLGVDERKIKLIVHGVDVRFFHPVENKEKSKRAMDIPQSHQVVISTRSLESIYDIDTLIKAVPYVLAERPHTYFLLIGHGTLRRRLEELATELGVTKNVRFVGLLSQEEIPKFLGASDVYVSTSLSDTTSVSLLEAMSCELPVVVTDLRGNEEWVRNELSGFLFPTGDFRTLAEKIVFLLGDADVRRKFGAANRRIAEKKGNYEKEMSKMEKLYEDLVEVSKV